MGDDIDDVLRALYVEELGWFPETGLITDLRYTVRCTG